MILSLPGRDPFVDPTAFIAPTAVVAGAVSVGARSSVWFGAVARGDGDRISIGVETNVQDLCVLHIDQGFALSIGDQCTIGHRATVHGCTVGNGVLIGMSATVLTGAVISDRSIVAAGSLVTERKRFPSGVLIMGTPAKVVRDLTEEDFLAIDAAASEYVARANQYRGLS